MTYKFYVIIDNKTGKFYKKHNCRYYSNLTKDIDKLFTDKLGRARIFESYAVAKQAIPHWYNKEDWLSSGIVSIEEVVAEYVNKRVF
jgi:hypothetical protein